MPLTEYRESIHNSADKGRPGNKQESKTVSQGVCSELTGDHPKATSTYNTHIDRKQARIMKKVKQIGKQPESDVERNSSLADATGAPYDFYMNAAIDSSKEKRRNKELGSVVGDDCARLTSDEVAVNDCSLRGVIQWFGWVNAGTKGKIEVVGIELVRLWLIIVRTKLLL